MKEHRQVALITGASSGFGLLLAARMAGDGYRVVAAMRRPGEQAALLDWARKSGSIEVAQLDVTDRERREELVEDVLKRYGRLDVLVNNAGYAEAGMVEELDEVRWRDQFEVNFFGLIGLTRAVLPHMRERRCGTVVNIGSISGRIGFPGLAAYSASKFAVEGFSESLRLEMLSYGVRVILIEPGAYRTRIWERPVPEPAESSPYHSLYRAILREMAKTAAAAGDPEEVVQTILRALRSPSPKLRYPVGRGVKRNLLLKALLPAAFIENIVARILVRK